LQKISEDLYYFFSLSYSINSYFRQESPRNLKSWITEKIF